MYITEAKRVIEELSYIVSEAKKFLKDREFTTCLAEEIKNVFENLPKVAQKAVFLVNESGAIQFEGIFELSKEYKTNCWISIPLENLSETQRANDRAQIVDKASKLAEECLDLDLKLKKQELLDKLLKK